MSRKENQKMVSPARNPKNSQLSRIRAAVERYHAALDNRQHGGDARSQLVDAVEDIMGMQWRQRAEAAK